MRDRRGRWSIIAAVMLVLMGVLLWRLYSLMIVEGSQYREMSDNKRIKEIEITAPRGNIYDRNGVLLAGTRTSFAVQAYKDDLMSLDSEERNQVLSQLIHFMERDGVDYLDAYPISLNEFTFETQEDYFTSEKTPREKVEETLHDSNLLDDLLALTYQGEPSSDYKVSVAARALTFLSLKGTPLPIQINPEDNYALSFISGEEYDQLITDGVITEESSPIDLITNTIDDNPNLVSQVLDHPAVRQLAYDLLKANNLIGDVKLTPFTYTYEMDLLRNKASLHHSFPEITMETTAQEDFVTIVEEVALDDFLQSVMVSSNNKFIIPAEGLLNKLANLGVDSNLTYTISPDASSVDIEFENEEETLELPIDRLKNLAEEHGLLKDLIIDDDYRYLAEQAVFAQGVYPRISTVTWIYGPERDLSDFKERKGLDEETAEEAFQKIAEDHDIPKEINAIEQLGILSIRDRVSAQGNYAYAPVNLGYELSTTTVAKIEENIPASTGIMISTEPIRYYPHGELAAHIIGYIGKIATETEIQKYINEKGYLPNELIGKTGVEESFEDTLHGVNGKDVVMIDSYGNRTETIQSVEPKAGNNLYLTIDFDLQKQSEKALHKGIVATKYGLPYESEWGSMNINSDKNINSGATISTDPNTGQLLAMVSYPSFDPNLFATGISNSDWRNLMPKNESDLTEARPLLNLATQTAVQPGSTFKVVTGLAALEKGLDADEKIECMGYIDIGTTRFNCLIYSEYETTHGPINVKEAIGVSCNYFFYTLGLGENPRSTIGSDIQVTVDDLSAMALNLGLGDPSGLEINYPSEVRNSIPSRDGKLDMAKGILRRFLNNNLIDYKKEEVFKNQRDIEQDIETIVSWADQGSATERYVIIERLESMGYHAEQPLENSYTGLADIIKYTYLNQANWTQSDSMNAVIGQGQNAYSPIALNQMTNIFANGGYDYDLTLVKEIRTHDNNTVVFQQQPSGHQITLDDMAHIDDIREGMRLSSDGPIARKGFEHIDFAVGSKTGTADRDDIDPETGRVYSPYAWYIAFAPYDDPTITTVTFLPNGVGSANAVAVTRDILAFYLDAPAAYEPNESMYEGLSTSTYELDDLDDIDTDETEESSEEVLPSE